MNQSAASTAAMQTASSSSSFSWTAILATTAILYPILCFALRFQRVKAMQKKFGYDTREKMAGMTNEDAQAITSYLGELEFPKIFTTSLQFALFKTYGIPTISRLLCDTRQLSTEENSSKRYADTEILIKEFMGHAPNSPRVIKAISRMNYIHNGYRKAGKILDDDMLYTLSVFVTEPVIWTARFEWREMTPMEVCAIGTFWKSIGDAMDIDYHPLSKHEKGWKDGIDFYNDIKDWAEEYEMKEMVPAKTNKTVADETVALLLYWTPKSFRETALKVITAIMSDRLRNAMVYDKPPPQYFWLVDLIFSTRRFVLRYLWLPRPSFLRVRNVVKTPDEKTGRLHATSYQAHPFYMKPGILNRWGLEAWMVRFMRGDVPGEKGDLYSPQGFTFEEVGPKSMVGKGVEDMRKTEMLLERTRTSGCPFAFSG